MSKKQIIPTVFRDKTSGAYFYAFDYKWSTYRSNQGFQSADEAKAAALNHINKV